MTTATILALAAAVQALMTVLLGFRLGFRRYGEARAGGVDLEAARLRTDVWSDECAKLANAYNNQFQVPLLFYAAALLAIALGVADWILAGLGALFVASRIGHAVIHTGPNVLVMRFQAYVLGLALVAAQWIYLAGLLIGRAAALA